MLDSILGAATGSVTPAELALCTGAALALGVVIALVYMFRNNYSKNLVFAIALLPAIVGSVITVVNGNLGAGVAVMGAFSLIRFRSAPGTAREIACIFFAMASGLACGMGYVVYAVLFTAVMSAVMLLYAAINFGERDSSVKTLRVTVPEDMEYAHVFDDLFAAHTHSARLVRARTTNLGGLYELQYTLTLKNPDSEKELLDKIRQRNGNLTVSCGVIAASRDEL